MDTTKLVSVDNNGFLGDLHILNGLSTIHGDVKDAECSIKDSIMVSGSQRQTAELNLHNRLCEAEKASIEAKWASVTQTKTSEAALLARIEECCCDMKLQNLELKQFVTEKFCDIERRESAREIAALHAEKSESSAAALLAAVNAIGNGNNS